MDVPGIVRSALDGEEVAAQVGLGGEDVLYVTPTRTLVYRGDGLLSDESVEEFPHGAERVGVSEGRRTATIRFDYGLDGEDTLSVPTDRVDEALHPVLAGVLNASDVTDPGETITRTYRFSELTLVVTSARLVKHVGEHVWDRDYEELAYADVTGIDVEEGNVASQLVLQADGRTERVKTPTEQARDVRETVESALFAYHGVSDREAFEREVATDAEGDAADETVATAGGDVSFAESGLDPIEGRPEETSEPDEAASANGAAGAASEAEATEDGDFAESGFERATAPSDAVPDEVVAELEALSETVERQRELVEAQQATIERLADELSRDR